MLLALSVLSYCAVFIILFFLARRDCKDYILPDYLNLLLALAFLAFHMLTQWSMLSPLAAGLGAAVGGGFLLIARMLAHKFYAPDSLGLGDVKLMTAAGLGLGYPNVLAALCLGSVFALGHGAWLSRGARDAEGRRVPLSAVNVPAGAGLAAGIGTVMIAAFGLSWLERGA